MPSVLWIVAGQAPIPTPSMTVDPESVTPGVVGFAAIALLTLVVIFLLVDMLRRIRRARYRSEIAEELDAEQQMADEAAGTRAEQVSRDRPEPGRSADTPSSDT